MNQEWSEIIRYYSEDADKGYSLEMRDLVIYLEQAGFVAEGLRGTIFQRNLLIGQSSNVSKDPHLQIQAYAPGPPHPIQYRIQYFQGSMNPIETNPWTVCVERDSNQLISKIDWLLTKRLRWFKKNEVQ